jgi:hypothetical protein
MPPPVASFTGDRNVRLSDFWPEVPGFVVLSDKSLFPGLRDGERVPEVLTGCGSPALWQPAPSG